jgi:phosphopantothenate-cysteine ligase
MNIVITAGGTSENIDSVRKITNSSSGKLGRVIAESFLNSNLEVDTLFYVCTRHTLKPQHQKVKIVLVDSTDSLLVAVKELLAKTKITVFIHAMAVSDYTVDYITSSDMLAEHIINNLDDKPFNVASLIDNNLNIFDSGKKIASNENSLIIKLSPTPKIISYIKKLSPETYLVGFKLLHNVSEQQLIGVGHNLLIKNNCNLVVANDLSNINSVGHKAFLINENKETLRANTKQEIAQKLTTIIEEAKL